MGTDPEEIFQPHPKFISPACTLQVPHCNPVGPAQIEEPLWGTACQPQPQAAPQERSGILLHGHFPLFLNYVLPEISPRGRCGEKKFCLKPRCASTRAK